MPDWPAQTPAFPQHTLIGLHSSMASVTFDTWQISGCNANAGAVWPAANRAIYMPFIVEKTLTVISMGFEVTAQSGNYDVGIYDELRNRLVNLGSTAVPAIGTAKANIADTTLTPGLYFAALNIDNTTAAVARCNAITAIWSQVVGVQQQAVGAVTLPNPATFANPASAYLPALTLFTATTF